MIAKNRMVSINASVHCALEETDPIALIMRAQFRILQHDVPGTDKAIEILSQAWRQVIYESMRRRPIFQQPW